MKKLICILLAAGLTLCLFVPALGADAPADAADLVTDAYTYAPDDGGYGGGYHVPQINLEGPGAAAVNAAIWADLYEGYMYDVQAAAESGEWSYIIGIDYSWAQSGDVLSLLAAVRYEANDLCDYFVYNVSLADGERLSDRELFQALGTDRAGFNELLRQAVSAQYDAFADFADADFIATQRDNSLSDEIIARAKPYMGPDGSLCAVGLFYPIAGAERCFQTFDLTPAA